MKYNRICQILGIEKPVIQGPLSWLTDARLVAAVSNAGGLGVLGPNAGLTAETAVSTPDETAEKMREEIRKTKKLTEKPFGVNLIPTPENDIWTPPILQVIKEEGVKAVVYTGYGEGAIITSLFNELKASGIAIIYRDINPTPENTRLAEKAGADIIVATGFDEGGTLPGTALGTFSIVPLIADSVKSVPVMAAGGITDSRTARAAHALGAEGVFAGSVFIGTEESRVPQSVKDKIINANGLDLLLFRTLPDYYRSLPGKLADKLVSMDKAGASNEELAQTMGGLRGLRIGMLEGNTDEGYIALGTGIGNIRSIKSVAEVVFPQGAEGVVADVPRLLNRGGMFSMMGTILLVFCAFSFAGALTLTGALTIIINRLLTIIHSVGQLIAATIGTTILVTGATSDGKLALLVPAELFKDAYRRMGLDTRNLSRTIEDAGTVIEPLLPWTSAGVYMATTLGVSTLDLLPWAIQCYAAIFFALIYGFSGIGIARTASASEKSPQASVTK
ncbi:hypothetical protein XG19_003310 [Salmonella enterica subsp. enterica serovar Gaminara]|nr:hypothetical protein [Salmonella enterica subsp. enterica serovar Gaminara]ECO0311127.1 hypothetical protein [Salmonella enterica subsp. enterica serovar Schwarzengrund]EDP8787648.1 hypothetical protein [Salmonella enterica subsp. enterica]ECY4702286.1 hypothetical protein [Salmonella enterica subsp. enterica serovar Gaminara]ECY5822510.1 hypothetical protein [Salmonella enterica subsp. enterica serovar Schwarzengrund]